MNFKAGLIDYDQVGERALDFHPNFWNQLFSYSREWDYARFSEIAEKCGAILMCCMAHIGGLGVAKDRFSPLKISSLLSIIWVAS